MIRRLRSARRRAFGSQMPHWANDILRAISYFNVLELIPTLVEILFTPRHFFRKLDLTLRKRKSGVKSIYKAPIGMAVQVTLLVMASLQLANAKFLLMGTLGVFPSFLQAPNRLRLILALLLISVPLLVPVVCAVLYFVVFAAFLCGGSFLDATGRGLVESLFHFLFISMDRETYRSLDWKKLGWGIVYFFGYLITLPAIAIIGMAFGLRLTVRYVPFLTDQTGWGALPLQAWGLIILVLAAFVARIVLYPYVALLVESRAMLTNTMMRFQISPLRTAFMQYAAYCKKRKGPIAGVNKLIKFDRVLDKAIVASRSNIDKEWIRFDNWWRREMIRRRVPVERRASEKQRALGLLNLKLTTSDKGDFPLNRSADDLPSQIVYQSLPPDERGE
jgi:hypothetical protein